MAKDLIDFSKFKKIFSDEHRTHLQHPKGHTIVIAHISLSPKVKEQLDKLPSHEAPKKMMEHALENAEHMVEHLAKGGKVHKKEIFGETGEPDFKSKKGKHHHAAQAEALNRHVERKMGLPIVESKGKFYDLERINKERKSENLPPLTKEEIEASGEYEAAPKSSTERGADFYRSIYQKSNPKPDWRSGKLEAQKHIGAKVHEVAHILTGPKDKRLGDFQEWMDEGSKRAGNFTTKEGKRLSGIGKQLQEEIQPMAIENPLRRRAGIPAYARPQEMSSIYGEGSKVPLKWEHPPRKALDTGEEYAVRLPNEEGNPQDLIGLSKNLSPENLQRLRDYDEGVNRFHPERGMVESMSPDALVNLRGQGRHAEAKHRLKTRGSNRFAEGGAVDLIPHYEDETHRYAEDGAVTADDQSQPAQETQPESNWMTESPAAKSLSLPTTPEEMAEASQVKKPEPKPFELEIADVQKQIDDAHAKGINTSDVLSPLYNKLGLLKETQGKVLHPAPTTAPEAPAKEVQRAPAVEQPAPTVVTTPPVNHANLPTGQEGGPSRAPVTSTGITSKDIGSLMQAGIGEQIKGIYGEAKARGDIGRANVEALDSAIKAHQANQDLYNSHYNALMNEHNNIVDDYYNEKIDPMAAWNDRSVPSKISTAIGLLLGGMGGGLLRQENPAMKFLQYQIDKSVEGQKMKLGRENNLLTANMNQFRNVRDAADFTRANLAEIVAKQIEMTGNQYADKLYQAMAQQKAGEIRRQYAPIFMRQQLINSLRDSNSTPEMREQTLKTMDMYLPDEAKYWRHQNLPNYGVPEREITPSDLDKITGINNFQNRARELQALIKQYSGPTGIQMPGPVKTRLVGMAHDLVNDLKVANAVDLSDAKMKSLTDQVGNPVGLWDNLITKQEGLKTIYDNLDARKEGYLSTGFGNKRAKALVQKERLMYNAAEHGNPANKAPAVTPQFHETPYKGR